MGKKAEQQDKDSVESWNEQDQRITVKEGNGFLYSLQLQSKVDSAPDEIYNILTDPNTVSIFRSIKECTYRRVLEDDRKGRRKLEIGHRAVARFLFLSISFETHLHVWEDDVARTIRFQTAKEGMMKKFDGCWHVQPFNQATLDSWFHPEKANQPHGPNFFNALPFMHRPAAKLSLVTLEQSILPRGPTPPGIRGLIRGLCAAQIKNMMDDLRAELERRKNGTSKIIEMRNKTKELQKLQHSAARAASISMQQANIWDSVAPINIVINL